MEEDKAVGKDLENTNDPKRKESGKTVRQFIMNLPEVTDLIKLVPALANRDFTEVAIKTLKGNGFGRDLRPDTLLSVEEIEMIKKDALGGIIKDISEWA